jgi:hypothetical protein
MQRSQIQTISATSTQAQMHDDPLEDERLTRRDSTTTYRPSAAEQGVLLAAKEKKSKTTAPTPAPKPPPKIETLYLYSSGNDNERVRDDAFGRLRHPGVKRRAISSWKGLVATLKDHPRIGTLVLMTHGVPGGLLIDSSWMGGQDAGDFLKRSGAKVDTVVFEGCMIMREPIEAAQLANGLGASKAIGYDWWHYTGRQTWKLNKKPAGKKLREGISAWIDLNTKYLIRTPKGEIHQMSTVKQVIDYLEKEAPNSSKHVYLEWFYPDRGGGSSPDPAVDPPRSNLKPYKIDDLAQAKTFHDIEHETQGPYVATLNVPKLA